MRLAEHQRQAALRASGLLDEFGGVLLADDVGLGKSFVAAAVMQTFRGEIELIVPASLVRQWRETLADAGVAATILTHDSIARIPYVPDPSRLRLIVVDEAHAFRNPRTQRYDALCRRSVGAGLLMITATPVCNSSRDLEALLALLVSDDALADGGVPSIHAAFALRDMSALEAVIGSLVIRRDRSVLPEDLRFAAAVRRVVRYPVFDGGGRVKALIDSLRFPLIGSAPLLRRLLWRRLESSEAALRESIRRQVRFYDRALDSLASGRLLSKREYRAAFGDEEDGDPIQQVLFWDVFAPPVNGVDPETIRGEEERLNELIVVSRQSKSDKRQRLLAELARCNVPVLVYTTAAATAHDVHEAVRDKWRSAVATSRDGRDAIQAFCAGKVDVLIATDLASEGLNLQRAGAVIHYDLPWNPVKLDQRNGRACRIGQCRDEVVAIYFLPEANVSGILPVIAAKNRARRRLIRSHASAVAGEPRCRSSLPPRVPSNAAAVRFLAALERRGLAAPQWLERRHKEGVERLLATASREFLDARRLDDLLAMIGGERP